jgi:hypothetical protein
VIWDLNRFHNVITSKQDYECFEMLREFDYLFQHLYINEQTAGFIFREIVSRFCYCEIQTNDFDDESIMNEHDLTTFYSIHWCCVRCIYNYNNENKNYNYIH